MLASSGVDDPDYRLFPDEAKQKEFIRMYLEESAKCKGQCKCSKVKGGEGGMLRSAVPAAGADPELAWDIPLARRGRTMLPTSTRPGSTERL